MTKPTKWTGLASRALFARRLISTTRIRGNKDAGAFPRYLLVVRFAV